MVHGLLITSKDDQQMQLIHLAVCQVANYIDGRDLTQRYTVFNADLRDVLKCCREQNVTVQEIIGAGSGETYQLHHQGEAPAWEPKKK